jgi:hypothetical protein
MHALVIGCAESGGLRELHEMSPTVHLVFSSPALPDPAAKPRHPGDLAPLDARFDAFSITTDAFRNMELGDCELVDEFVRQVLPKLATRNIEKDVACMPHQLSGSHYWVRGEGPQAGTGTVNCDRRAVGRHPGARLTAFPPQTHPVSSPMTSALR